MMMIPNVQVYPLPRSACQSCGDAHGIRQPMPEQPWTSLVEEEERTKPGPGADGFERLGAACARCKRYRSIVPQDGARR